MALPAGVQINAPVSAEYATILTPEALELVAKLHRAFEPRRKELLKKRVERQARIDAGEMPDFLPETKHIREGDWKIAPLPKALECRRVEITGPVEAKMIINAYNSGRRLLHDRLRGFQQPEVGQPDPGPDQPVQGHPPPTELQERSRQGIQAQRQDRHPADSSARLAP
jgi:hypothetical protein